MTDSSLVNIRLQSLWPRGCHPQRLPGRFDGAGELIFALAPYLQLEWTRQAKKSADAFDLRNLSLSRTDEGCRDRCAMKTLLATLAASILAICRNTRVAQLRNKE
jgi:hypothetical protein